jgi:hypothetical protein
MIFLSLVLNVDGTKANTPGSESTMSAHQRWILHFGSACWNFFTPASVTLVP